jgi:hypothetical protein
MGNLTTRRLVAPAVAWEIPRKSSAGVEPTGASGGFVKFFLEMLFASFVVRQSGGVTA